MAREVRKIIYSVQAYEDAKSAVGWIIFAILALIVLICAAIYYIAVGIFTALKFLGYYFTWIWWYPVFKASDFLEAIELGKGIEYALLTFGILFIFAFILSILCCIISCKKFITGIAIFFLLAPWLCLLITYIANQIIF